MPRVKLIRHGTDDNGDDHWGFPIYPFGQCPHPRMALRFDPRYPMPYWCYCRACGEAYIDPYHGLSEDEVADIKERAKVRAEELRSAFVEQEQD